MTKDLKNSILKKIEQDKIRPRSKLYFFGKNLAFWGFFLLAIIFGALSFSVMLYAFANTDFDIRRYLHESEGFSQILALMPFIWMLCIGIAIGLGIWGLKHTKKGYRIALVTLVGSNILGSVVLGSVVYSAGGGEKIEEALEKNVSFYRGSRKKHQKFWGRPEETGRLSGMVDSIDEKNKTLRITDPTGRSWEVQFSGENRFEVGLPIRTKGEVISEGYFRAEDVRPAPHQKHMQKRVKDHFEQNPELRAKIKSYLSPETKEALEEAQKKQERIPPELRRKIREEIKTKATPEDRQELRPIFAPPRGKPGDNPNHRPRDRKDNLQKPRLDKAPL